MCFDRARAASPSTYPASLGNKCFFIALHCRSRSSRVVLPEPPRASWLLVRLHRRTRYQLMRWFTLLLLLMHGGYFQKVATHKDRPHRKTEARTTIDLHHHQGPPGRLDSHLPRLPPTTRAMRHVFCISSCLDVPRPEWTKGHILEPHIASKSAYPGDPVLS